MNVRHASLRPIALFVIFLLGLATLIGSGGGNGGGGGGGGGDTTPPTVSITTPMNGASVSGTVTVGANATDNVGVVGVQFNLDGSNLGAEDTAAPYAVSWDTTTVANGSHTLTAVARDAAGNTSTSTAVSVTVSNVVVAPAVLDAEAKPASVTLTWNDTGASSYNLYYATAPNCNIAIYPSCPGGIMVANVASPYTVRGLANGQNYWFKVESVVPGGNAVSNEAGARPDRLIPDNAVYAIAHDASGTTYLGGVFSSIGLRTGMGVPLGLATGRPGAFPMVDGTVMAAVPDGAGGYYIGGQFTVVGGVTRNRLAHILADGTLGAWNPGTDDLVRTLAVAGDTVYVGGDFRSVAGQARGRLAAVGTDGTLLSWNPGANGSVETLAVSGDTVYVGGSFTSVAAQARSRLAAIGTDGTLLSWNPDARNPGAGNSVETLAVSGDTVYVGGHFTSVAGQPRSHLAAVGTDGTLLSWNPGANDWVETLAVSGDTVYVGGSFSSVAGQPRSALAAIGTDGTLLSWNPGANDWVYTFAVAGDTVYVGGYFTSVAGQPRSALAAIGTDGTLLSWNPGASGAVVTLAVTGGTVYVGGGFTHIGGELLPNFVALPP